MEYGNISYRDYIRIIFHYSLLHLNKVCRSTYMVDPMMPGTNLSGWTLNPKPSTLSTGPMGCHELLPGSVNHTWVVVKVMPFWIPMIIRHLIFRAPQKGP